MTDPTAQPPEGLEPEGPNESNRRIRRRWYVGLGIAAVVLLVVVVFAVRRGNDDEGVAIASTTSTTSSVATTSSSSSTSSSTTERSTTTTSAPAPTTSAASTSTTGAPPPTVDLSSALWPSGGSVQHFTDPIAVARGFTTSYLGFVDPVVGAFQQGDVRSGEVDVRPEARGPATTILVRQLGDGAWYVLGATTPDVSLTRPTAGSQISSPVALGGTALAFEGQVAVEVRQDGSTAPLGEGSVTGGGDVARPFVGSIAFRAPTERAGAIVLLVRSERDGSTWAAVAMRVRLG